MQTDAARDILLDAVSIQDHKTRRAVVAAMGDYRDPRIAAALIEIAKSDQSYAVTAEACKGLGKQAVADDVIAALTAGSQKTSWRDQVRTGLVGLGWSARDADKAIDEVAPAEGETVDVAGLLRAALQRLSRA